MAGAVEEAEDVEKLRHLLTNNYRYSADRMHAWMYMNVESIHAVDIGIIM